MDRPFIGVAVIIRRENKVLLGKRKNAHGEGHWAFPGGHLEFNESIEHCARREIREETGLEVGSVQHGCYTNDFFAKENKHYVTLFVVADWISGEAEIKEPDKCEAWQWFAWEELPEPRFLPIENLLTQNFHPFAMDSDKTA